MVGQTWRQGGPFGEGVQAGADAEQIPVDGGVEQVGAVGQSGDQVYGVHQQRRGRKGHGYVRPNRFGQGAGGGAAFQLGQGGAHRIGVGDSGQIGVGLEGATDVSQRLGVVAAQRRAARCRNHGAGGIPGGGSAMAAVGDRPAKAASVALAGPSTSAPQI